MSVRNSFAFLDDSDDDEPRQQVKAKAKAKPSAAPSPTPAPARNYNNRGPRRDGDRRDNRGGRRGGGEYTRETGDGNPRKYRRDDRRTDRRRDAERRDRRREGGNPGSDRRGRNQYEKTHQKRGPKKGGHGGWGTDKDAVDVAEETAAAAGGDTPTPTAEDTEEAPPAEPAAPAVTELTLEEHEAAEKERRAKFNERWGSKAAASASVDLEKDFTGMKVVSKKTRKLQTETWAAARKANSSKSSKSAQKAKQLKQAIFAEPKHDRGYRDDRGRGGRGRGRGGSDNRGSGGRGGRRYGNVNTQNEDEFPALA